MAQTRTSTCTWLVVAVAVAVVLVAAGDDLVAPTYQPMMRDLSTLSGKALDRAFLRDMTIHHVAAVTMSQHLLARGLAVHPQVARLARTIRDQQHAEIFRMQRWLQDWYGQTWHGGYGRMMGRGHRWTRSNGVHGGMAPSMMR